jgi:hypothetical protein
MVHKGIRVTRDCRVTPEPLEQVLQARKVSRALEAVELLLLAHRVLQVTRDSRVQQVTQAQLELQGQLVIKVSRASRVLPDLQELLAQQVLRVTKVTRVGKD